MSSVLGNVHQEIRTRVTIDRFCAIKTIPSKDEYLGMLSMLHTYQQDGAKVWKSPYKTHCSIRLGGGRCLNIALGTNSKKLFATFDLKPSELLASQWSRAKDNLAPFFHGGYNELLATTRTAYLEIAVDFIGLPPDGIIPYDSRLRTSSVQPSFLVPNPSVYLGRRGGPRVLCEYDRRRKLEQQGCYTDEPITRVEARLRRVQVPPLMLGTMPNPFATAGIARWADLSGGPAEEAWLEFLWDCRRFGSAEALQLRTPHFRKQCLERLRAATHEAWRPGEIWDLYPAAIAVLLCGGEPGDANPLHLQHFNLGASHGSPTSMDTQPNP